MKKAYSIILIILLLISFIPQDIHGNIFTPVAGNRYVHNKYGYSDIQHLIPSNIPKEANGYPLNATLYMDKGIIAYGNWSSLQAKGIQNDFKKHEVYPTENPTGNPYYELNGKPGEFRYHGFDQQGNPYTNIDFPKDVDLKKTGAEKNWIYRPYQEMPNRPELAKMSDYSSWATQGHELYPEITINTRLWINSMIDFPINSSQHSSKNPYDYIHVLSPAGTRTTGEGRMWHIHNGRRFYQTFSIPRQQHEHKVILPVTAEIEVITPSEALELHHGQKDITIDVKVKGIYEDGNYWKTEAGRTAYYTGYDIDKWEISLMTTGQEKQTVEVSPAARNTGEAKFQVTIPRSQLEANPNLQFTGTAKAILATGNSTGTANTQRIISFNTEDTKGLLSLFNINNYIALIRGSNFSPYHLNYQDASLGEVVKYDFFIQQVGKGQTALTYESHQVDNEVVNEAITSYIKKEIYHETNGEFKFLIRQTVTDPLGKTDTYEDTIIVDIKPPEVMPDTRNPVIEVDIPERWFDIVPLPVSNSSQNVGTPKVYIDGQQVDSDEFFSGNYVFGESDVDRLLAIEIVFDTHLLIPGGRGKRHEASMTRWIYVHTTKPRAEFQLEGTYKQNRLLSATENISSTNNAAFVLEQYPIADYEWRFKSIDGDIESLRVRDISQLYKEFILKEAGGYSLELIVTNTLGRKSDPYEVDFWIMEDYPPAVILNLWNNTLARNEAINLFHDAVSTDGDTISKNIIELYYDDNNDGEATKLLGVFTPEELMGYTPTQLGTYKVVNIVEEAFGEATLEEFITEDDLVKAVVERTFYVDNFIPLTELYIDVPIQLPEIDVLFMLDKNLDRSNNQRVLSNRMDMNNYLRTKNIRPKVETWDMHTYVYSQAASSTRYTGNSYPPATINYASNGYTGTLTRTNVSNSPYTVDEGYYTTIIDTVTTTERHWTTTDGTYPGPPWNYADAWGKWDDVNNTWEYYYVAWHYDEIITTQVPRQVWVHNWVSYDDYTGFYNGTIYKYVRQPYVDPFRTLSDKYIIYVSDGNISELHDLQMVLSKADAKVILIGENNIRSQIPHEYFIQNNGPIEELIKEALDYIAETNPYVGKYYVIAKEDTFHISYGNYDDEGDPIIEEGFQYVQDQNYFDTPLGMEHFTVESYDENTWTQELPTKLNTTGKFEIYRRIKDQPTTDPNFASFSYYSNIPQITVYSHRRPIALAELDWDYDPNRDLYLTTWVDKSFDWDHIDSREDKGIVERKIRYRRNGGEWIYRIPDELTHGNYELEYYVKDPENTWSHPFKKQFTLSPSPPMQFEAKARTLDNQFTMGNIPASETLEIYDLWTRYPYQVRLEVAMYQGETRKTPIKTVNYSSATGKKTGNDIHWNNINYQIPETLPDGKYTLRVSAIGERGEVSHKNFPVRVNTPINLRIDAIPTFISGTTTEIEGKTTKYAHQVEAKLYYRTIHETKVLMTSKPINSEKSWRLKHFVPETIPDGFYKVEFTARTPNGNEEQVILDIELLNLRLENLRITTITDFSWQKYFKTPGGRPTTLAQEGIPVADMPVNRNKNHQNIKLGYKVKFKIDTIGLHQQGDEISIKAKYYALDQQNNLYPADVYVLDEDGDYIKIQESSYRQTSGNIRLREPHRKKHEKHPQNDKYNTWDFEVFIPYNAKVVKEGEKLDLIRNNTLNHRLLVVLEIEGRKANGVSYDYTLREKHWGKGQGINYGRNRPTGHNLLGKGVNHGEVFWYDLRNTAIDDFLLERGW